ncbi:flagellar filament capping protein FliD [Pseudocolwellia sp. AS88]|uniref:flagellar filament capping protein FliD n=1 Tax=Pseudocolwellia sp. AS88 TaxID=3063958 RepID=UPI0026ECF844|nr:flagellar filament capping protein FliD [Pseudocolwellia sp. AS88]MDO7085072.1 flagellar filament capping protein FliD [Pseudocolwellia sp. AS88]
MLSFTGIGSGLAVSDIVDALVGAERTPFESRLNTQEAKYTTDISAVGALKSAVETVQASIESLSDADNYQQRTASGSDSYLSLTSTKDAEVGSYSIKVDALASEHKLSSAAFTETDALGEGTLTFASGENSFDIVASDTDTLSDIRDAINDSADNESIIATIVTGVDGQHLVLASKETGLESAITITVDDTSDSNNTDNTGLSRLAYQPDSLEPNFATNMTEVIAASDAQITLDGSIIATSSTNTFTEVIDGIDVTVKKAHDEDDDNSNISISENNSNIASGLNSFIESYNELLELSNNLGSSSADGVGVMAGDSLLRGLMSKLRSQLSTSFSSGEDSSSSLSQLGVRTDRYGVLSLDSEDLNTFIDENVDGIQEFFVGTDSEPGFAASMDTLMSFYTDSGGLIQSRIDSRTGQLERIDEDRLSFELKMDNLESRLLAQYNAMDLLVANLNSTSSYVQAQLDNMPGVVRSDS